MATITVLDADGVEVTAELPLAPGRAAAAASRPVVLATEDKTALDAIGASAAILDDWDESDRAKVNLIVGQAGIAAGAGAVGATVPRVTHASDDPAVTALQIIDDWDESDRAKVNVIVGQAGVAAGSGTVSAATQRVVLATDVGLPAGTNNIGAVTPEGSEYETVAASQTAQTLGATGATGDYLAGLLVIPATVNPGVVTILDNATSINVFAGGTASVGSLVPFPIPLGIKSVSGAWKVTTGADVSVIAIGNFT